MPERSRALLSRLRALVASPDDAKKRGPAPRFYKFW
jgi:hypothetical protein